MEKVATEEVETIGKKGTEVEPLEVKAVESKIAQSSRDTYEKVIVNAEFD